MRKILKSISICTLLIALVLPVNSNNVMVSSGNTIYVDDDNVEGPWDGSIEHPYQHIQDAIDHASDGDALFVFNGTYYENVIIDKSIKLTGENKYTTLIDGSDKDDVVKIIANSIILSGFTIQNSGKKEFDFGIEIQSDYNKISGNIIQNNGGLRFWLCGGISLMNSSYNEIYNNSISSNDREGIYLDKADYNIIYNNKIYENNYFAIIVNASSYNIIQNNDMSKNYVCMSFWPFSHDNEIIGNTIHEHDYYSLSFYTLSNNNVVRYNNFSNNIEWSIRIAGANNNLIEYNDILGSPGGEWEYGYGIGIQSAFRNTIRYNNIMNNKNNAVILNSFNNHWIENYWDDHKGFGPKVIQGYIMFPSFPDFYIPWLNFDWHPAREPYNMGE